MKRILVFLLLLIIPSVFAQSFPFSVDDANAMFVDQVISKEPLPAGARVIMHPALLQPKTVIQDSFLAEIELVAPAFFIWVDPMPKIAYSHPTFYYFLFDDGNWIYRAGGGWAIVNGQDFRKSGNIFTANTMVKAKPSSAKKPLSSKIKEKLKKNIEINIQLPSSKNKAAGKITGLASHDGSYISETGDCPEDYEKIIEPFTGQERGVAMAVADTDNHINFYENAHKFMSGAISAGFENAGIVRTYPDFSRVFHEMKNLPKQSTFALYLASHGGSKWLTKIEHAGQIQELIFTGFRPVENSIGVPQGAKILESVHSGYCFTLGSGQDCYSFNPNLLALIPSCRKFLASETCYAGSVTHHSVEGLSAYAATNDNEFGWTDVFGRGLSEVVWGKGFGEFLIDTPPRNPKNPVSDEPKPEFDSAHAAGTQLLAGYSGEEREYNGVKYTVPHPTELSIPMNPECGKTIVRCRPRTRLPPPLVNESLIVDDAEGKNSVGSLRRSAGPEILIQDGESRVRMERNSPMGTGLDAGPAEDVKQQARCPPGYVAKEVVSAGGGSGVAIAIADDKEPNIKLVDDANRFLSATSAAGFTNGGMLTSVSSAVSKILELRSSLEKPSSLALFISAHGSPIWKATLINPNTDETRVVDNFIGMDVRPGMVGFPQGWDIVSKEVTGLCVGLNGQCLKLKGSDFAAFKSCRKFVGSSACFSGILTDHNVPGLSVYAGSQADRPGLVIGGKSLFGNAFTTALLSSPPADPLNPDSDEPKPEFDAAFGIAAASIANNPLQGSTLRIPSGRQTIVWRFDQRAVSKSVEGEKNCQKKIECVPSTGLPPPIIDDTIQDGAGCEGLKAKLGEIPVNLRDVMTGDANYKFDRLQVFASMIQYAESLKACYKCPPNTSPWWKNCNPPDGLAILDSVVAKLRAMTPANVAINPTLIMDVKRLIDEFMKCEFKCRPMTGSLPPSSVGVVPGGTGTPVERPSCETLGAFTDEVKCKRSCKGDCSQVRASFVNPQVSRQFNLGNMKCWICGAARSVLDEIDEKLVISNPVIEPASQVIETVVDCQSVCGSKGMSTQRPSSASVLQQLQQYRCVSNVNIQLASASSKGCVCYGTPQFTVDFTKPVCQTRCGPVPCDGGASCSCGERCTVTVSCAWGGWKEIAEFNYAPVVAST